MVLENKVLYAPSRKEYWSSDSKRNSKNTKTCIFCHPQEKEVVITTKKAYLYVNKYPYSSGHLLVIPKRHINQIIDLTSKEREEMFNLIDLSIFALNIYLKPDGFNVGCAIGDVAGESINHLHFHVLPRRMGDSGWVKIFNFQIVSETPEKIAKDLKEIIKKEKLLKKFNL